MSEKTHWPFGSGDEQGGPDDKERAAERQRLHDLEREQARARVDVERRQQLRLNRLLVGGRAHTRKRGLS